MTVLYWFIVLLPLLASAISGAFAGSSSWDFMGKAFALVGMAMLMFQPFIASGFRWMERPFGLDRLFGFHRFTGAVAGVLLLLHPVMLSLGVRGIGFLTRTGLSWFLVLARVTLLFMAVFYIVAAFRKPLRIPFQWWLRFHGAAAPLILAGAFVHAWRISIHGQMPVMRWIWTALLGAGFFAWLHLMLVQRLGGRLRPYGVTGVASPAPRVWNLELVPPEGHRPLSHMPGQFVFVTLLRGRGLPREEHPFSVSSSPSGSGALSITCKESGDFTATIGKTRPGDRAVVRGPYGRFSYLIGEYGKSLVFIAGGIGITPLISMLRHMRETGDDREVTLIWANRTVKDMAFRDELASMESLQAPLVSVVHVLSQPEPAWTGERGHVNRELLERLLDAPPEKDFFICGPPPMMKAVSTALSSIGVPRSRIHMEMFSL